LCAIGELQVAASFHLSWNKTPSGVMQFQILNPAELHSISVPSFLLQSQFHSVV